MTIPRLKIVAFWSVGSPTIVMVGRVFELEGFEGYYVDLLGLESVNPVCSLCRYETLEKAVEAAESTLEEATKDTPWRPVRLPLKDIKCAPYSEPVN